jgi:hypothetical protein
MFAVCWVMAKGKVQRNSKNATVIEVKKPKNTNEWLDSQGLSNETDIIVFKRVSSDFKTQEGTPRETLWEIGKTISYNDWDPKSEECGHGKFHACSRAYFCDQFRSTKEDRYIAIAVKEEDLYAFPNAEYPHKVAFREGTILYECDRFGKKLIG